MNRFLRKRTLGHKLYELLTVFCKRSPGRNPFRKKGLPEEQLPHLTETSGGLTLDNRQPDL